MRRVCLTIGISRAEGLEPLRAAATAAEEVGEWARISKFAAPEDICVLTDQHDAVTVQTIADAIKKLLPMGKKTDAFLLHFAGHGLREDNTRTLWLPTNWRTELRAIAVERLKNRLSDFGIDNLTIISDACKALANDKDSSDLTADGVLGAGTSAGKRPIMDRYDAVHDIESAFMVPGKTPDQSRCIFSGALVEALWGRRADAFDKNFPGKVTPGSLHDYLSARVEELCAEYEVDCEPQLMPGRPEDHLIYFDRHLVPAADIPPAKGWPPPIKATVAQGATPTPRPADPFRLDDKFLGEKIGTSNPDISALDRKMPIPDSVKKIIIESSKALTNTTLKGPGLKWLKQNARGKVERAFVEQQQKRRKTAARNAFLLDKVEVAADSNLIVRGDGVKAVWSNNPLASLGEDQWKIEIGPRPAQQIVIEYGDGVHVPVVIYRDMITIAGRDQRGTTGWMFMEKYGQSKPSDESIEILLRMQNGKLPANEVDQIVAHLREMKHTNPTVGAICSYLYDYIGDIDSIRRMAYFYKHHGQAIPFDIALMGELHAWQTAEGYQAQIPEVPARTEIDPTLPGYVTCSTSATTGLVGGLCPWLRQGWDFVEAPTDREAPLVQNLPDVRKYLLPETFTSFDKKGGKILVKHWNMERKIT
jgi:hypothetical protein